VKNIEYCFSIGIVEWYDLLIQDCDTVASTTIIAENYSDKIRRE